MKRLASANTVLDQKVSIAWEVVHKLRRLLGRNIRAACLRGSVAQGTAERFSDIDFLFIIRKPVDHPRFLIVKDTYCSFEIETYDGVIQQLREPHPELPELLGGFTKILPLYDPERLFPKIEAKAQNLPAWLFKESAKMALLESYEDFCRVKNAYLEGDEIVLKDNVLAVTHSAALVVASINRTPFPSDRMIFKAHRDFSKVPYRFDRIEKLRYGSLKGERLFNTLLGFYLDLILFAKKEGISFPVSLKTLKELGPLRASQ